MFFSRLGQGWEDPVHRETLHESVDHVPKEEKLKEAEKPIENSPEEKSSTETEEKNENVPVPTSSPSNEELAKMWQPKTRQSIAQRLKRKIFLVKLQQHTLKRCRCPKTSFGKFERSENALGGKQANLAI